MPNIEIPDALLPLDGRFGCGPSKIRPEQIKYLADTGKKYLGNSHRQAPVRGLVRRVQEGLAGLFDLPEGYEVVVGNGGSTAFWDAAAYSLVERRAEALVFGEFGSKFAQAASAPFLETPHIVESAAGSRSDVEVLSGIDTYAWTQNETSTGVAAPVNRVHGDSGALTVIDATSSAGGMLIDLTQTDVYYFAPQKNFASEGGLWFAILSPAAIERVERIAATNRHIPEFLSLKNAVEQSRLNQTLNTPAVSTLLLLENQIEWITSNGGLEWAAGRTRESSNLLYEWADRVPYASPYVKNVDHRSPVVVTIDFDDTVGNTAVSKALRDNGIVDTEPYRKLGRNQLRIATYVAIEPNDIRQLIRSIEFVVDELTSSRSDAKSLVSH